MKRMQRSLSLVLVLVVLAAASDLPLRLRPICCWPKPGRSRDAG